MELEKNYYNFIFKFSKIRIILFLLGIIIIINFIIFPLLKIPKEKLLDTRLYYSSKEAINYSLRLSQTDIKKSIIMHSSVDILYPCIYTLFISSIILFLKGDKRLVLFPLLIFSADILENFSIILLLLLSNKSIFFKIPAYIASAATPIKWLSFAASLIIIIFLGIRRYSEKMV